MRILTALLLLLAITAQAETPRVVTSIQPVHSLVTDIMDGVGEPELLLVFPASSHDFALKPSQVRAIGGADVIFYLGLDLDSWMLPALESTDATFKISLGELPNLMTLPARELSDFDDHDDHDGSEIDPHVWLDPRNTLLMLDIIAGILAVADPVNGDKYRANLEETRAEVIAASNKTKQAMKSLAHVNLIVSHDSIQYFENAYDLNVIGAFSASDGQVAGARNTSNLHQMLKPNTCVVFDLSHPSKAAGNLSVDQPRVLIDPMGYMGSYAESLAIMTDTLLHCLD